MTEPAAGRIVNPVSSACVYPMDTGSAGKMVSVMVRPIR
jgi:hypothetical protein